MAKRKTYSREFKLEGGWRPVGREHRQLCRWPKNRGPSEATSCPVVASGRRGSLRSIRMESRRIRPQI